MPLALDVWVIPRAKKTGLAGTREGAVVIRVAAPPVEGAANEALLRFLAEHLGVPRRAVRIVNGQSSRRKRVEIAGLDASTLAEKISS